jgi:hypothetical protein
MSLEAEINHLYVGRNKQAEEACWQVVDFINAYQQLHDTDWFKQMSSKASGDQTVPSLIDGLFKTNYIMPEAKNLLQVKENLMILNQNISKMLADPKDGNIEFQMENNKYHIIKERNGEISLLLLKGDTNVKRFTLLEYMKDLLSSLTKTKDLQQNAKLCSQLGMLTIDYNYQNRQLRLKEAVVDDLAARLKKQMKSVDTLNSKLQEKNCSIIKYKYIILMLSIMLSGTVGFTIWLGHQANSIATSMVCSPK